MLRSIDFLSMLAIIKLQVQAVIACDFYCFTRANALVVCEPIL